MKADIYKTVTERILQLFESAGSWDKLWQIPTACNLDGRYYRGINTLLLASNTESRVFGTFNQIRRNGGQVRLGEKGSTVVFWKKMISIDRETGKEKISFLLRYYYVFNSQQATWDDLGQALVEKLNNHAIQYNNQRHKDAEAIVKGYETKPMIIYSDKDDRAFYQPKMDFINIPDMKFFVSSDAFYQVLFHEMVHSTGHPLRLNRDMSTNKATDEYSKEELVAELGASFLSVIASIKWQDKNSTAYIKNWSDTLRENPSWLVNAASKAEKAVDYILGTKEEPVPVEEEAELVEN